MGLIIYKSKRRHIGKNHDYNIYKKNHLEAPEDVESLFDLDFVSKEGLS